MAVVALAIVILVMVTGILGNILVCLAVTQFRNLRIVANSFVVSLAIADLLVCTVIMPFALYQEVTGEFLHETLCKVWSAMDIMLSTSSVLHLCAISVDRFSAITAPIKYVAKRTGNMAFRRIAIVWVLSSLVSGPALFFARTEGTTCVVSENTNAYAVCSSLISFYIPCLVILIVYFKIYNVAKRRARRVIQPASVRTVSKTSALKQNKTTSQSSFYERRDGAGPSSLNGPAAVCTRKSVLSIIQPMHGVQLQEVEPLAVMLSTRAEAQSRISLAHERKAARTIGVVVSAFIVCWLPFFTLHSIFNPLCLTKQGGLLTCEAVPTLYRIFAWVGWCNSSLNPIIYTVFNKEFCQAFQKLLLCRRNR